MRSSMKKSMWLWLVGGVAVALVVVFAVRVLTAKSDAVHYHADFGLYVNGVRDEFKGPGYYEEVQACTADHQDDPKSRVHMHNEENSIVHVHDHAVTWGAFFANLGYTLGDKVLVTTNGVFADGADGNKLSFILNGKAVDSVADRVVGNEDVLLIDYGHDDQVTLQKDYEAIPRKAHQENLEKDPASCGGASPHLSIKHKLVHGFKFWQ